MAYLGEAAALATAIGWAGVSLLFTAAARRSNALAVNLARISLALPLLTLLVLVAAPAGWTSVITGRRLLLLAVSGWVGLTLGDWALFSALVLIGPRLTTLMLALSPPIAALLAVPLLGEHLGGQGLLGMAITLAGIAWVVLDRRRSPVPRGHRILGLTLAVVGAVGQGTGLVLSKLGMDGAVPPLPATLVRMTAAAMGVWLVVGLSGRLGDARMILRDRVAARATVGATLLGPVMGVWLSLVAVAHTEAGVAATLMAPVPVFVLPLVAVFNKERIRGRAILGALVAVAGVVVLVLR